MKAHESQILPMLGQTNDPNVIIVGGYRPTGQGGWFFPACPHCVLFYAQALAEMIQTAYPIGHTTPTPVPEYVLKAFEVPDIEFEVFRGG